VLTLAGPSQQRELRSDRPAARPRRGWAIFDLGDLSGEQLHPARTGDKIDHVAYSPDGAFVALRAETAPNGCEIATGGLQAD
jgi:hypothetical protein